MLFSKNLRYLRRKEKMSQNQLADNFGYKSFTTIQKWEDGTSVPSYKVISQIAQIFKVDVEDFMNKDLEELSRSEIPVLGIVRGGQPINAEQNYLGFEHVFPDDAAHDDCFYLEVVGDSMKNARIMPKDLVYVHRQSYLNSGDIGVVLLDNSEATIKRVIYKKDTMILQPENENYEPIILTQDQQKERNVKIIGKVLHVRVKL